MLDEPITLVIDGNYTIEEDVTLELIRQKVRGLVLHGKLTSLPCSASSGARTPGARRPDQRRDRRDARPASRHRARSTGPPR